MDRFIMVEKMSRANFLQKLGALGLGWGAALGAILGPRDLTAQVVVCNQVPGNFCAGNSVNVCIGPLGGVACNTTCVITDARGRVVLAGVCCCIDHRETPPGSGNFFCVCQP